MKKTKLFLRRESITQLTTTTLGNVHGGIQTTSNTCASCGCQPPTSDCPPTYPCQDSVSSVMRTGQRLGC